jgi:D-aminoacyl-tRNA deacylase
MIILTTKNNPASKAIADGLIAKHGFKGSDGRWVGNDGTVLLETNAPTVLEVPTDFDDTLIILSTHKSKVPGKMLTAHVPGNWGKAEMGGEDRTLNIAPARLLKTMLIELKKEGDKIGWPVSLEADHHGPASKAPLLFVEIGNGEEQWEDKDAADAVANAVVSAIKAYGLADSGDKKEESVFAVGGGHYPRTFTKLVLETDVAVGHILPKYSIESLDEGLFRQAIERNVGKVTKVLIAKDETNVAQKDKIRKMAESFGIQCELV